MNPYLEAVIKIILALILLLFGTASFLQKHYIKPTKKNIYIFTKTGWTIMLPIIVAGISSIVLEAKSCNQSLIDDKFKKDQSDNVRTIKYNNIQLIRSSKRLEISNENILKQNNLLKEQNLILQFKIDSLSISRPEYYPLNKKIRHSIINELSKLSKEFTTIPTIKVYPNEGYPLIYKVIDPLVNEIMNNADMLASYEPVGLWDMGYSGTATIVLFIPDIKYEKFGKYFLASIRPYLKGENDIKVGTQIELQGNIILYLRGKPVFDKNGRVTFQ